jgi:hypothetical protein
MIHESTSLQNARVFAWQLMPRPSRGHHFLDVMILARYNNLRPFLCDVYKQDALTSDDYGRMIGGIIQDRKTKAVRLTRILMESSTPHACVTSRAD